MVAYCIASIEENVGENLLQVVKVPANLRLRDIADMDRDLFRLQEILMKRHRGGDQHRDPAATEATLARDGSCAASCARSTDRTPLPPLPWQVTSRCSPSGDGASPTGAAGIAGAGPGVAAPGAPGPTPGMAGGGATGTGRLAARFSDSD